jgi:predicted MPP superfamily phosphohydrolase
MIIVFLLLYFLIYGSLHVYIFIKVKSAFAFNTQISIYVGLFLFAMILSPVLVRMFGRKELDSLARILSYIGYTWMGFLFLFCSASLVLDILTYILGCFYKTNLISSAKVSFFISCVVSLCISVYSYYEAKDIRVEKILIKSRKIPREAGNIKIVQISDVHLGLEVGKDRLTKIVNMIKDINPDVLLSTGDLVDAATNSLDEYTRLLNELNPKYGKYAITGNHEYFAGIKEAADFIQKSGFKLLRGEAINVENIINIAGIDDSTSRMYGDFKNIPEERLLSDIKNDNYTILLKHVPYVTKRSIPLFDLQLSGHTHKGQIFPFSIIVRLFYPRCAGFWRLGNDTDLYISRGTGTWGPLMRFMAPPEITEIELRFA